AGVDPWRRSTGVVPPADVTGRRASRLPLVAAAVVALAVVVALVVVLRDGGDGGVGTFEGEVAGGRGGRDGRGLHPVSVGAGSVVVARVAPDDDLDAVVGFVVSADDAEALAESYEDTPFAEDAAGEPVDEAEGL